MEGFALPWRDVPRGGCYGSDFLSSETWAGCSTTVRQTSAPAPPSFSPDDMAHTPPRAGGKAKLGNTVTNLDNLGVTLKSRSFKICAAGILNFPQCNWITPSCLVFVSMSLSVCDVDFQLHICFQNPSCDNTDDVTMA